MEKVELNTKGKLSDFLGGFLFLFFWSLKSAQRGIEQCSQIKDFSQFVFIFLKVDMRFFTLIAHVHRTAL